MRYNIVCGIDNNFVEPLSTMLNSIFINNHNDLFDIYVLCLNVSAESKLSLETWITEKRSTIHFIDVNKDTLKTFPLNKGDSISLATYLRLFIPNLLPSNIDKILYLDTDILFLASIKELYSTNISDKAIAAVSNGSIDSIILEKFNLNNYFNAGLLLMNLKFFREQNITEQAITFAKENSTLLKFHDQDILNALLKDSVIFLPQRWNIQEPHISKYPPKILLQSVIHFSGKIKPWHVGCTHKFLKLYKKFNPEISNSTERLKNSIFASLPKYKRFLFKIHAPLFFIRLADWSLAKIAKFSLHHFSK